MNTAEFTQFLRNEFQSGNDRDGLLLEIMNADQHRSATRDDVSSHRPGALQTLVANTTSGRDTQSDRRQCRLRRIPGFTGYGFGVNKNQIDGIGQEINQVTPSSPADLEGSHNVKLSFLLFIFTVFPF